MEVVENVVFVALEDDVLVLVAITTAVELCVVDTEVELKDENVAVVGEYADDVAGDENVL